MVKSNHGTETPLTPKAQRTRANLLSSARHLVGVEGSNGVTVMAVCERAGVGRTSFYNYFEDVSDLLQTVVDETGQAVQAQFEALHGERPRGLERLELCLQMLLQLATTDPEFGLVLTSLASNYPETTNFLRTQIQLELSAARAAGILPITQEVCETLTDFLTTTTLAVARDLAAGRLSSQLAKTYANYLIRIVRSK